MLKHLKLFEEHSQYEEYVGGGEMILPNVSYCKDQTDVVHYNPTDITVEGKFTVPSRFYDTVINNGGGMVIDPGGGAIAERSVGGTTRSLAKSATISSSSVYTGGTCYGLDSGLRMITEQTIEYDNHTPLLNAHVVTLQTDMTDSVNGNKYSFVNITGFPSLTINNTNEEVIDDINSYETIGNVVYYYPRSNYSIFGRMDSEGNFECGEYNQQDNNDAWVFKKGKLPKMSVKQMNFIDSNNNPVTADINCIHVKEDENEGWSEVEYDGTGSITIGQPQTTYYNSLLPITEASQQGGLSPTPGPILAAVRSVNNNEPNVHDLFKAIKVDGEEIDIDELVENEGWYQFDEGVHTIVYVLNTATNNAIYKGFLMPGLFTGIAIEEVQLDERIKGSYMSRETQTNSWGNETVVLSTPFDNCALLGTDEETINKICTIKQLELSEENGLPLRTKRIKPLVLECEFEDEDDIICNNGNSGGRLSNQTYFAICNEKAGMHVCTSSGSDGGGGGEAE